MEQLKNIPEELKKERRFICFNDLKQPINPKTLNLISIKNQKNLMSYKNALESLKNSPKINGIGFVLGNTQNGNFCGLDIDNCISSNGVISSDAQKIIDLLDTYTEISPSKKGVHCIFFAQKQGNNCKKYFNSWCKCLEMYDKDRYFTLTGNVIKNKKIEFRQNECNEIYDTYLKVSYSQDDNSVLYTSKNHKANFDFALNNDKVLNLYWQGTRPLKSESENDYALMGKILFWVGYDMNIAFQYFLDSPHTKQKDKEHIIKILNTEYLIRTAEKIINSKRREMKYE